MLGVFVFSASNELLYAYGNPELSSQMTKNSRIALISDRLCASTSSGVYSDGSSFEHGRCTPECELKHQLETTVSLIHSERSRFELGTLFLPLISIYRMTADVLGDPQQSIESSQLRISFVSLEDSSLIIIVSEIDATWIKQLTEIVQKIINFHHGPLLSNSAVVVNSTAIIKHRFESVIMEAVRAFSSPHLNQCKQFNRRRNVELDITNYVLEGDDVHRNMPQLDTLSKELYASMGPISCLLFVERRFMGIKQVGMEDERKYLNLRMTAEVVNWTDLIDADGSLSGESVHQVWVSNGQRRFLNNLFVVHHINNAVIVCVKRAEYAIVLDRLRCLISKLCTKYLIGDNIAMIEDEIDYLCATLSEISFDKRAQFRSCDTTFLRNIDTTNHFVWKLWHGIRSELSEVANNQKWKQIRHPKQSKSNSLSRRAIRRLMWPFASNAHSCERERQRKQEISPEKRLCKLHSTINYFKHHLKSIFMEICMKSLHNAKTIYLKNLSESVRKFLSRHTFKILSNTSLNLNSRNILIPSLHKLDMIAYSCVMSERSVRLTFIPEKYDCLHEIINTESTVSSNQAMKICYATIEDSTYLMVTVKVVDHEVIRNQGGINALGRTLLASLMPKQLTCSLRHSESPLQCIAAFESFVNKDLALKQTIRLASSIRKIIHNSLKYITS